MILLLGATLLFCGSFLIKGLVPGNFGDLYQYVLPFRHFAAETLQGGHVPLWNPYIFSGSPFLASPQSALFYPGTLLFYFFPAAAASGWFAASHLFLNALGMYLLLRALYLARTASLAGALAWGFSFFFLAKFSAGHIIHLSGYSWFCFCLVLILRRASWPLASLAAALMFFSGHLQVWVLAMIFVACLWMRRLLRPGVSQPAWEPALSFLILLAGVCLVQALPALIFSLRSFRAMIPALLGPRAVYDFASSYSMEWKSLITLILPNFFGNPVQGTFIDPESASTYLETYALYFGLLPLGLAVLGFWDRLREKKYFMVFLAFIFLILATGKNSAVYAWIWRIFSPLRVPARFYFLFLFLMTVSAALCWNRRISGGKPALKAILILLIFLDLYANGKKMVWSQDPALFMKPGGTLGRFSQELAPAAMPFRIFTGSGIGNPNKAMLFRVPNANGYEALWQGSAFRYFLLSQGIRSVSTTGFLDVSPDHAAFKRHAVKYYVAGALDIRPVPAPFPFSKGDPKVADPVLARRQGPNKIVSVWRGSQAGTFPAFLSEAFYPGWEAWTDQGNRLEISESDGYFMTASFPNFEPPDRKIYWIFRPLDFHWGAWVSAASVLCLAGLGMYRTRKALRAWAS